MNSIRLVARSLRFHGRGNLAVALGTMVAAAVVGGALIVGDSVRGSLLRLTDLRLGGVNYALHAPRFFREQAADELAALPEFGPAFGHAAPALFLTAGLERAGTAGRAVSRAASVNLYAVDERFWMLVDHAAAPLPSGPQIVLNSRLAAQLAARTGDTLRAAVELPSSIPREALLGEREETTVELELTVSAVLEERDAAGRFGLAPDQQLPLVAYAALRHLQERLGLAGKPATPRDPAIVPARVNALVVGSWPAAAPPVARDAGAAQQLDRLFERVLTPADLQVRITTRQDRGYLSVESERMILEPAAAQAAHGAAQRLGAEPVWPVLVYLANEIRLKTGQRRDVADGSPGYSRYAIVAGVDPEMLRPSAPPPFGPFRYVGEPPAAPLTEGQLEAGGPGEVVINEWLAADLGARPGDELVMTWHKVGSHGELPEESRSFLIRGILALDGTAADDRGMTPEVRGITDVETFADWKAPFPMKKVTRRDDDYWKRYRATPKAFMALNAAQQLWRNKFGQLTSLRAAIPQGSARPAEEFGRAMVSEVSLAELGLAFRPVRAEGQAAAAGTTDFGGLFIGFSFFVILAAAILIGLLFRLGIERRAVHVGLFLALGLTRRRVYALLLGEALAVVALGTLLGAPTAVGYAWLMVLGLKTWWVGAIGTRMLDLYCEPGSLLAGLAAAACLAMMAAALAIGGLMRLSARRLLSGATQPVEFQFARRRRSRGARWRAVWLACAALALAAAVVLRWVPEGDAFAGFTWPTVAFFVVGCLALLSGLAALSSWIDADRALAVRGRGPWGLCRLALRNGARHRTRTLYSTALVAAASFLIVAIAAGRRNPAAELPDRDSGNGGFMLVAEASVPLIADLGSVEGRAALGFDDPQDQRVLQAVNQVLAFRVNPGENSSCLNVFQTRQPTILGVPAAMIERGGFDVVGGRSAAAWRALAEDQADGPIPVLGDMNTLQYSLHVGLGSVLEIRAENGSMVPVRIAGMFDGSIFQGVLLMGDAAFQRLFPSRAGFQYFLIDALPGESAAVTELLESRLAGLDVERVADRLASFLAVQNTYLSTFQALGGLGLLLGTAGLATVMLRNVLERRGELALLRAVGFRRAGMVWLVCCENGLLLVWGLAVGTGSALLAMAGHLAGTGAEVPWSELALILAAVFAAGSMSALAAARAALATPVVATLRNETA